MHPADSGKPSARYASSPKGPLQLAVSRRLPAAPKIRDRATAPPPNMPLPSTPLRPWLTSARTRPLLAGVGAHSKIRRFRLRVRRVRCQGAPSEHIRSDLRTRRNDGSALAPPQDEMVDFSMGSFCPSRAIALARNKARETSASPPPGKGKFRIQNCIASRLIQKRFTDPPALSVRALASTPKNWKGPGRAPPKECSRAPRQFLPPSATPLPVNGRTNDSRICQ